MRKLIWLLFAGMFLMVIGCQKDSIFDFNDPVRDQEQAVVTSRFDQAAVDAAIANGLSWMVGQQDPTEGFFNLDASWDKVARTSFAVTKLCDWTVEHDMAPCDEGGDYYANIQAGLAYLFTQAQTKTVTTPEGDEEFIIFNDNPPFSHETYNTSLALMAISAYRNPDEVISSTNPVVDGMTYKQVAQSVVDFFAASQNPDGGWRYYDTQEPSDQSNTGFVVLGLTAAAQLGCDIPESIKTGLASFITVIQDPSGGSWYTTAWPWLNVLKTGNLLFEIAFVGDYLPDGEARKQAALDFIETYWEYPTGDGWEPNKGWKPYDPMAMYCLMKGFINVGVETFGDPEIDWYEEFVQALVSAPAPGFEQNPDGYWPQGTGTWIDPYLATVLNLLTLEKFTPIVSIPVEFDIKPTSCPNPLNMKSGGVLPVAILGTEDFDVSEIDVSTLRLGCEAVEPVQHAYEDVAAPVEDPQDDCECTTEGSDGFMDLTVKFDKKTLVLNAPSLEEVSDGQVVPLTITGKLLDGTPIVGSDCVVILLKNVKD